MMEREMSVRKKNEKETVTNAGNEKTPEEE